jgi:hypothetical protein
MKNILLQLTTSKQNEKYSLISLISCRRIDERVKIFGNIKISHESLFTILMTFLSYIIVLIQFEIESEKVQNFDLFKIY